ncbi:M67 family metallopeptidase [Paenibacillus mendelii]|uniref:M67 family metallopeptidase n=1 Tax=Paenibacillus mendelii TaxID=206163 RepID=A0ABV6J9V7_9BACL|nr:M67 family metallopeptidase [Paenibacillus mendelii]MCQ6560929.1 M67 family metallopeptidase [Paenibacillus mendelii]
MADLQKNSFHPFLLRAEIDEQAYRLLIQTCTVALPYEACGVLAAHDAGVKSPGIVRINAVYPIRNAAQDQEHVFSFEPQDWIAACYAIQKNRQSLVGFYHSHPGTPPLPSTADAIGIRHAAAMTYWIVSLANPKQPDVQPYQVSGSSFIPLMFTQVSI